MTLPLRPDELYALRNWQTADPDGPVRRLIATLDAERAAREPLPVEGTGLREALREAILSVTPATHPDVIYQALVLRAVDVAAKAALATTQPETER